MTSPGAGPGRNWKRNSAPRPQPVSPPGVIVSHSRLWQREEEDGADEEKAKPWAQR